MTKSYGYYHSPIGCIEIVADSKLISLSFVEQVNLELVSSDNLVVSNCIKQLEQYFAQKLQEFNLPLAIKGTEFQELVWKETLKIPYGSTFTYQQLAQRINKPKALRAVGSALKKNPLAIIVPCHRVVASDSKIVSYFWGRDRKIYLQQLENK